MPDGCLEPRVAARLAAARADPSSEAGRRVFLGALEPGMACVVEAEVRARGPNKDFTRRDGVPGSLCRLTLVDVTGEADLVLWNEEIALADGPLQVGHRVVLRGADIRHGFGGGAVELHLGQGRVEVLAKAAGAQELTGELLDAAPWDRPDGRGGFDVALRTDDGEVHIAVAGQAARAILQRLGGRVRLIGVRPNPAMPGCFHGDDATRVLPA